MALNKNDSDFWQGCDVDALVQASKKKGPFSGLATTQQGTPAMAVDVASGVIIDTDKNDRINVNSSAVSITAADTAGIRFDMVYIDSANTIQKADGTVHSDTPTVADLPSGALSPIAVVRVNSNTTVINDSNIRDLRISIVDTLARFEGREAVNNIISLMNNHKVSYSGNFPLNQVTPPNNAFVGFSNDSSDWDLDSSTGVDIVGGTWTLSASPDNARMVFVPGALYDQYNGTIDTTLWTLSPTGGNSEDSNGKTGGGTAQIKIDTDSAVNNSTDQISILVKNLDFKTYGGDSSMHVVAQHKRQTVSGAASANARVLVGDTLVYQRADLTDNTLITILYQLVFDKTAGTVDVYVDGSLASDNVDISGEANWNVKIVTYVNGIGVGPSTVNVDLYLANLYYNNGSASNAVLYTKTSTIDTNQTRAVSYWEEHSGNPSAAALSKVEFSHDSGSNFDSSSDAAGELLTTVTNAGTGLQARATIPQVTPNADSNNAFNWPRIIGHGLMTFED